VPAQRREADCLEQALIVKTAPIPDSEAARLEELRGYCVLDTPPEQPFDDITALAAQVCRRPIALVSLVDADRQWFKSRHGLDVAETPRDVAFCAHAILNPEQVMVVPDAHRDERFADNPLVTLSPHIRAYAGAPLVGAGGEALGTLCVLDREPADFSEADIAALRALARQAMVQLELRRSDVTMLRTELEAARHRIGVLEAQVTERTAELQAARDSAEAANRAKSDFLSQMSHELRTPLNAILGFAQVLRIGGGGAATARSLQHVEQIEQAGRHLLELINDLLDLSRIESGTMVVGREPIELRSLCAECVRLVKPMADAAAITVIDKTAETLPLVVWGDRTRLIQVLMNLLSNGVKYNREGGTVTLTLQAIDELWAELAVADTGPGFTEEQLGSLYQPFNRLGAERSRTEGTGVGLVIAKRLTEMMGGSISVATQQGEGSCFTLRLARALPGALNASAQETSARTTASAPARKFTVLYVEDDPLNVELVKATLALRPGVELVAAPDGPSGLEMAEAQPADLIVLDIGLPGIDGHEVCRRLRARAGTAKTTIIALSANAMPADFERGRAAGFDAYLTKPLDVEALLAQVDRAIEDHPSLGA
jgi:signal transduction histidine kinase/ActR/RegA family two-component response regulator